MIDRLWKRACLLIATIIPASPLPAASASPRIHRIVAIGDLHGDFSAWRTIARAAGLIDANGHWAGGDTVFVQTGDVTDRGPDTLDIVHDLMRIQREAPRAGGKVITLVGNHEAMNLTDDLRYVAPSDYAAFVDANSAALRDRLYVANQAAIEAAYHKHDHAMTSDAIRAAWYKATPLGMIEHQTAWHPTGEIGQWVASNPAVVMLDDTIFVHGGISADYDGLSIAKINRRVDAALMARNQSPTAIINDDKGPLWYRGLVTRTDPDEDRAPPFNPGQFVPSIDQELDQVLGSYHAKRMVIGHTPILSGITITHGGKLIRIDTGISAFYGGALSYLEIVDGNPVPHEVKRSSPQ